MINPQEFVKILGSIPGIEKKVGHLLSYKGRELYVLQDFSGFPSSEPLTTAYAHWRNHPSYKLASSVWIPLAEIPINELAILLKDEDILKGEFRKDLATGSDNSHLTTGKDYSSFLQIKEGRIIKTRLDSQKDIESLLNQIK